MDSSLIDTGLAFSSGRSPQQALLELFLRRSLLGLAIFIILGLALVPFFAVNQKAAAAALLGMAAFTLFPTAWLVRTGRLTQAAWVFLTNGMIMMTVPVVFTGGAHGQPLQIAVAVIAVVLLNWNAAVIFAGAALLADLGVFVFQLRGGHIPMVFPVPPFGTWLGLALVFALVLPIVDRAMRQLRESEERFRTAFRLNPEGILIATSQGGFLEVNDAFLRMSEYSRPDALERSSGLGDLFATKDEFFSFLTKLGKEGSLRDHDAELRTKTGGSRYVQISAERIRVLGQDCILAIIRNTTEQRLLEQRYRRSQKMEALGRVATGIVHRFNQIVAIISVSAEILETLVNGDHARELVRRITGATASAASMMKQMLDFTRQQVLRPRLLDLNVVIEILWDMTGQPVRPDVETEFSLQDDLGKISADCAKIEDVIMNLTANARDAMPDGGKLTIRTADVHLDPHFVLQHGGNAEAEEYVMLAVADTGTGMSAEVKERIFEPFFTTKEPTRALGLGLASAYGIVEQSGGFIVADSEQGKGSTFRVYLPKVRQEAPAFG